MRIFKNKYLLALVLVALTGSAFADTAYNGPVDNTKLGGIKVEANVVIQPYMLAQGTVSTYDWPYYVSNQFTTLNRCGLGTRAVLTSSIKDSYINSFYAIGGINNSLRLSADYTINGSLYMDNRGAVGGNTRSPATASWQIWCQPVRSA